MLSIVSGATERLAGDIEEDEVGIEAPDDTTLVVTLRHPASYFLDIVATPATFVVPDNADATPTWQTADTFVGSGPYVIDGTDGLDLVLRANARYVAGPPPIDEIRWVGNIEANTVEAFADDQIDLAQVPGWDATWIAYDKALGPRLNVAEPLAISYFGFDTTRPPFDDERVRLAFSLALDRERLVPLSEGASAQAAASLVPPPSGRTASRPSRHPTPIGRASCSTMPASPIRPTWARSSSSATVSSSTPPSRPGARSSVSTSASRRWTSATSWSCSRRGRRTCSP